MRKNRIAVVGAGIAGLTCAVDLARQGVEVDVFERAALPGGKLRRLSPGGLPMDAGPTVFTLRQVFDEVFDEAHDDFGARVDLQPATVLARHAWDGEGHLDLLTDLKSSADAIAAFAGAREAAGFLRFAADARRIHATLDRRFMRASRPSPVELVRRVGFSALGDLWNIKPFATLWQSLGGYFADPRLRQLFGRYATYCGSSPFSAPATLMLIAHVEQAGVWQVRGGLHRVAEEMAALARRRGARLHCGTGVRRIHVERGRVAAVELDGGERVAVDGVVCNADNNALASGLFGEPVRRAAPATAQRRRSLSAVTWNLAARTSGFPLAHHSVFFGRDYRAEFAALFGRREMPACPTIYACAPDRGAATQGASAAAAVTAAAGPPASAPRSAAGEERLFLLINAPADGDEHEWNPGEIESCGRKLFQQLAAFGLRVETRAEATLVTTPADFHRLFPATGGALYGPVSHGWRASFKRPGSRSRTPGLYLAGGSTHPGAGVPMAAISGRLAAAAILRDFASTAPFPLTATVGGTSTR